MVVWNNLISKCPICKSENTVELYPSDVDIKKLSFTYEFTQESRKTFRVVRCRDCTHVFCSPLPKNIYKNYEDVVDLEYLRHSQSRKLSAKAVLSDISKYISNGRLLDVGCATGDFLSVANEFGYSVDGLELSHWSSEIARKRGINVYSNSIKSLARKFPKKYDVVTLWGVIEHFEYPGQEMQYLNQLLKPGGFLVLWTGDVDGIVSRLLGRKWWYWQGQHIQYFTHKSLNYLAEINGFEHIRTKRYPLAVTCKQLDNSLKRYRFKKLFMMLIKPMFIIKPIWYLRLPGEMFWIGRKKL